MRSRAFLSAPVAVSILMLLAAVGGAGDALAQRTVPDVPPAVFIPEDTGAGVWDGTYLYASIEYKIALWIRTRDGSPEMKLRVQAVQTPEAFETDWSSKATYYVGGQPASFEITYKSRDARRMVASWHWEVGTASQGRMDDAEFSVYRSAVGRTAIFKFDRMERQVRAGNSVRRFPFVPPPVWNFHKVSKRSDVLWEELPL